MTIPKILLLIEHEPADKGEDGELTTGSVIGVRANLPSRYFDVVVREAEATERDADGAVVGWECDSTHPRGEAPFQVAVEPARYTKGEEPNRQRDDALEEWNVMFWHANEVHSALVLKASDVMTAAARVTQEFPLCRIVRVEEAWLDEHPMTCLDENKIILPVGGPRVPTQNISEQ